MADGKGSIFPFAVNIIIELSIINSKHREKSRVFRKFTRHSFKNCEKLILVLRAGDPE